MQIPHARMRIALASTALLPLTWLGATAGSAMAGPHDDEPGTATPVYTVHDILSGTTLSHSFTAAGATSPSSEALSHPDDLTVFGNDLFVAFQNGVGPQGQPSTSGNPDSTIVQLKANGDPLGQWEVLGKVDGMAADPKTGRVIATVNEDGNSSLYAIDPSSAGNPITHFAYNKPLPHNGGTDAISIVDGQILTSASAPGSIGAPAPQPTYPAVYAVSLDPATKIATVTPVFGDEDSATVANVGDPNYGHTVTLGLTDPDSTAVIPAGARFGGAFMLTSQGDQQQIYVSDPGTSHQHLSVLALSQAVDDTAWPVQAAGRLYATDSANDAIDTISGAFSPNQPFVVATPCGANSAPATCPAPPAFPVNYLATLDPGSGQVSPVTVEGAAFTPAGGLVFVPRGGSRGSGGHDR